MTDIKDIITISSVAVAFIGVIYSVINSKRTVYINAVTTSRIRYMENLRTQVSEFCSICLHIVSIEFDKKNKNELLEKVYLLEYNIKLNLNRTKSVDKKLITSLDRIHMLLDKNKAAELEEELNNLILYAQDVLSLEWAGIKAEAVNGRLGEKQKNKFNKKYLPRYEKE
jgi:hypothetical protein